MRDRLAQLGQLAAVVAHELRNPLAAVRSGLVYVTQASSSIEPLKADPRYFRALAVMEHELETCARLIADLLEFSRVKPVSRRACELRSLVDEALRLVPQPPRVSLINEVPAELPAPRLDADQFRRVFINLAQNAAEALPDERGGRVVVHATGGGAQPWVITVTDDGTGIPAQALPRIFEPMFTTKRQGTGLGLAIVKGIVRGHDGTIEVAETGPAGTRIRIELPAGGEP